MPILENLRNRRPNLTPAPLKRRWRDALAGRSLAPRAADAIEQKAVFAITLTGFQVHAESWDDALQRDGKRDEVFYD
jgi:hypothetical protein